MPNAPRQHSGVPALLIVLGALACGGDGPTEPARHMAFATQPGNAVAGIALSPAVRVEIRDASGSVITDATDAVTLALGANPGGATLTGTATVAAVSGVATFNSLSLNKTGSGYTLVASAPPLASTTSAAFAIAPGPPAVATFSGQPTGVEAHLPIQPAVTVTIHDALGNLAAGSVTMALGDNPEGGPDAALGGTLSVDAVDGVASFANVRVNRRGDGYTIVATAGAAVAESEEFDVFFSFLALSAAGNHVCARTASGTAYCWGDNSNGQLGDGTRTVRRAPVAVAGGLRFSEISAGPTLSCGIAIGTRIGYCWGLGGTLGDGTEEDRLTPVPLSGTLRFTSVSAGTPSCGITEDGDMYCWGLNLAGGLGNGTTDNSTVPVPVSGSLKFSRLSAGAHYACGITPSGIAYCWGANDWGQLGDGTTDSSTVPVPVAGGHTFSGISASVNHTCGITDAAGAHCWGAGGNGELGDGTSSSSPTPIPVSNSATFGQVSVGGSYSCGITSAGSSAYCWGFNLDGQLGDGTNSSANAPVAVVGGRAFPGGVFAAKRGAHSCGISLGRAYCWGSNGVGQLGDGTTATTSNTPVLVLDP
jgi:hypothetical protein